MKTIVLTGGGTGGHIIPHLSLLPHLKKHFNKIYYLGTSGLEKEIISKQPDITFYEIPAQKMQRDKILKNLSLPFCLLKSVCICKKILKQIKPDVIFSKGGFVSVPVCLAGKLLKIPIVSHESDLSLGLANKIIYKVCTTFCTTFFQTAKKLNKAVYTGSPIRQELFSGSKQKGYSLTGLTNTKPTVMIIGGSTGALTLNKIIYTSLPTLIKKYNIIHIVGKNKADKTLPICPNYCQIEYCHNIEHLFAITDFVVSRAGSNAICEFLALKKPMLLIPLPRNASRGDQIDNAKYFQKQNLCLYLPQEELTEETLMQKIDYLHKNKTMFIENMTSTNIKLNGTENILQEILKVVKK
ncbi:MAG: undecaprenyldiphospho-muramoylpentapeptide beta-N-acetylglucosaminyltransferase [Clostridia bacterium]|nr:undecaprenyldiphospho-muramoylpentapeptide beta-N-acetylglucosaminyltransferase [Clostridia bacterium]